MDLIIYHNDCPDGFCAAFVAKKKYPEAVLFPRNHGLEPPYEEVRDKDVLVVDFSWRIRGQNITMRDLAKSFTILDHHKTAEAELRNLDFALFDMNRSGAGLTWDYLFGKDSPDSCYDRGTGFEPRPWYVNYVEDRDLWRHALPNSKEINAYIMTLPHTLKAWSTLDIISEDYARELGEGALSQINHYVEKAVAQKQAGSFCGHSAAVVNAQYMNISEVAGTLCDSADIGVGWFERGDGVIQFSLRSRGDLDVSKIAQSYGGGGHQNAAGFQVSIKNGREIVDRILGRESRHNDTVF